MHKIFQITQPNGAIEIFGVRLVGVNADTGKKLLFTLVFVIAILLVGRGLRELTRLCVRRKDRFDFWARQFFDLITAAVLVIGVASIWFSNSNGLSTAVGLASAGLAFALQKVVTAFAGYFVILRGKVFNVGDRIKMGRAG